MDKSLLLRWGWVFFWVFLVLWAAEIVIHYYVIYPYLKNRGIHPALRLSRNFRTSDAAAYKRTRSSAGEPLTWWYIVRAMRILGLLLAIGCLCRLAWTTLAIWSK
jgi:hypothetical protein